MLACLPDLKPNVERALKWGFPEGRRLHQCVGQQDPNIIFSRDCMHQNKAFKS